MMMMMMMEMKEGDKKWRGTYGAGKNPARESLGWLKGTRSHKVSFVLSIPVRHDHLGIYIGDLSAYQSRLDGLSILVEVIVHHHRYWNWDRR
jgi:hypothetical protein